MKNNKPNILFFFPDQFRSDWIGVNGSVPVKTPNIDKLAKSGTLFSNAYTPSPLCAPARACLASGQEYRNCGVKNNFQNYPLNIPTYYQALRDIGYNVAGVGKFDLHKDTRSFANMDWGLDGSRLLKEWGFTHGIDNEGKIDGIMCYIKNNNKPRGPYLNFLENSNLTELYINEYIEGKKNDGVYTNSLPEHAYCDNWVAGNGLNILKEISGKAPWHMVVNFTGPHSPMDVTEKMRSDWSNVEFQMPYGNSPFDNELELARRQNYAAMIENIDSRIGSYIKWLKETGEFENTIIIFSSDHGEMLGDQSLYGKGFWYEQSVKVPLIISGPDVCENTTNNSLVVLQDLSATILEYANTGESVQMEGQSLCKILREGSGKHRDYIHSALSFNNYNWEMIYDGRYKYIKNGNEDILYDIENDQMELNNIASCQKELVTRLKKLLDKPAV